MLAAFIAYTVFAMKPLNDHLQPQAVEQYCDHWEPPCFYLITALHLFPLLTLHFFPTVDGAAHVYNAQIIKELLAGNDLYSRFFAFNPVVEPNWLGHAIIGILSLVFSPLLSEKIFIAIYIIALPLSFRRLVLQLNPNAANAAYLIFPFIYSFTFIAGFYNFSIALPLMFIATSYWLKIKDELTISRTTGFSFLLLALFFGHLFIFGITGLIVFLFLVASTGKKGSAYVVKGSLMLFAAALPGLLLAIGFFANHYSSAVGSSIDLEESIRLLIGMSPTLTYDQQRFPFARVVFCLISALLLISFSVRLRSSARLHRNDLWLLISMFMLALYFIMPGSSSSGGFITVRLGYLFFLFLVLWIALQPLHRWVKIAAASVALVASLGSLFGLHAKLIDEDAVILEYVSLGSFIEEGSTVLPLNYGTDWRESHLSNYLAYGKDLVILENYEPTVKHFPLVWKPGMEPLLLLGDFMSYPPCADIPNFEKGTGVRVDYVVLWRRRAGSDPCSLRIEGHLRENYAEVARSKNGNASVWKREGDIAANGRSADAQQQQKNSANDQ